MLINKKLAVATVLVISQLPLATANAATNINIAVAANFATPLSEIITNFQNYYSTQGFDYTVTVTSGSTTALETQIINGTAVYDLFLAANQAAPVDLYNHYQSKTSGSPFLYARGYLELMSNTGATLTSGLPTSFTSLVIANPSKAPYGLAASQVLAAAPYNITLPNSKVTQDADIGTTFNDAVAGTYPYGFVAKSQICTQANGVQTFSYPHYSYTSGYDNILQYGIAVANSARTSDQSDELTNFLNYLQDSSLGGVTITKYCYTAS